MPADAVYTSVSTPTNAGGVLRSVPSHQHNLPVRDLHPRPARSEDDAEDMALEREGVETTIRRARALQSDKLDAWMPVISGISIGAYFGVGVRVLLNEFGKVLPTSETHLLELLGFGFFLANILGCFVMGFTGRMKPLLSNQYAVLLTAITTGFCGCCTTFASWMVATAAMFVHGKWLDALLSLGIQFVVAYGGFRCGIHAAEAVVRVLVRRSFPFKKSPLYLQQMQTSLDWHLDDVRTAKSDHYSHNVSDLMESTERSLVSARDNSSSLLEQLNAEESARWTVDHDWKKWSVLLVLFTALFWCLAFVGFSTYLSSRLLAIAVAPFGALARYLLSLLNTRSECKHIPLFTLLPNVLATFIGSLIQLIGSATASDSGNATDTFMLLGDGMAITGFLGSLSTVSTWINELDALASKRLFWAYRYAVASLVVSLLGSVFILGLWNAHGTHPLLI